MASPASSQRRRANAKRQPLTRTNTLFGAIKNIVTAPLSWFASTDDFEDARDSTGKRRRLAAVPTEPILDEGSGPPRNKRMRVDSPPRGLRREGAYLDPPSAAFQQPPSVGRSVSSSSQTTSHRLFTGKTSGNYVRSTISPLRNLSISRTMSVDPPLRPQSREGGVPQSQRPLVGRQDADSSMESVHSIPQLSVPSVPSFARTSLSMPRDLSTSHSRPPFRMRTSLTPQPTQIQRERSEPPPLQLLRTHPTFVKPPPLEESARASSHEPTLGSLVDSVRRTESPARQHGSLLFSGFSGKTQAEPKPDVTRAQRALHELEIYKTPLLPTRLRNGAAQASITGVPDLFKPRRNKLLLIKDEKQSSDRKLGQKEAILSEKNGTKPYAGAGDMKKMLVKRKLELEGEDLEEASEETNKVEEDVIIEEEADLRPSTSSKEIPPLKDDWYSLATVSSSAAGGSSLRVGRAKSSRNHISRPVARSRTKFSAAFDDEGDDTMVEQDKERMILEEAVKKAPVFEIPAGFSFSKDVKPIEHDTTNAKEPPIKSLPFSLSVTSTAAFAPTPEKSGVSISAQLAFSAPPTTSLPFSFEAPLPVVTQEKRSLEPSPEAQPSENPTSVPNFFARSAAFNKPLEIKTPPLTFSSPAVEPVRSNAPAPFPVPTFSLTAPSGDGTLNLSSTASPFGTPAPAIPVKDSANPFWDGERQSTAGSSTTDFRRNQPQLAPILTFVEEKPAVLQEPRVTPTKVDLAPVSSPFGNVKGTEPGTGPSFPGGSTIKTSAVKFDSPGMSLFGNKPTTETSSAPAQPNPPLLGRESPALTVSTNASGLASSTSTSLFGGASTGASKAPAPFGTVPKLTSDAEKPSFPFAQPTSLQAPKPVSNNLFTFNTTSDGETKTSSPTPFTFTGSGNKETKSVSPAPFTFGGPSTPVATEKATTPFTFGPPASPAPLPTFSFDSGGNTAGDASKSLQAARPATPPKNAEQEFKMEESPTREIQQSNGNKPAFGGFTFGNPPTTNSVLFGGPSSAPPTTTPFPFGSSLSNPFGPQPIKETKSEEPKPFSFVQSSTPTTNTGFPFGQTQATDSPRPSTTGSFNFSASNGGGGGGGGGGGTPTSTTSGFNFGATPTSNPFGQPAGGSAPSSPSSFQTSLFNFGAPSSGTPFSFGSQPASPATGSTNLPQATTPVTFGSANTGFGSSAPSSPFSAPTQIAPSTSSGGTLFTIGSAPPQASAQGRAIKKLPRGRAKR